jgi:hypothetical protein
LSQTVQWNTKAKHTSAWLCPLAPIIWGPAMSTGSGQIYTV